MSKDDVQSHLDKGMYGTPLVNPEEQHKYMGTFRERCYLSMTVAEMKDPINKENFLKEIEKQPDVTVLLNGSLPLTIQNQYIQLATKQNVRFTIVNDYVSDDPNSFGLLVAAKEAVNEPVIDVEKKYPKQESLSPKEQPKKKVFGNDYFKLMLTVIFPIKGMILKTISKKEKILKLTSNLSIFSFFGVEHYFQSTTYLIQ